jgi:thiol-disulfide isomerase/thioredoxin
LCYWASFDYKCINFMKHILILIASFALLTACNTKPPKKTSSYSRSTTSRPAPTPTSDTPAPVPDRPALPADYGDGQVLWVQSERLIPVLEEAKRVNKPVFVEFYAKWCAPCKVMDEEIFTQPTVYNSLNRNFLNVKLNFDLESAKTVASIYEVTSLPTILMLDAEGVVLQRHTGMMTVADFQRMSREVGH